VLSNYNGRLEYFHLLLVKILFYIIAIIGTAGLFLLTFYLNSLSNIYTYTISTGTIVIMGLHKFFLVPSVFNYFNNGYLLSILIIVIIYPFILVFRKYIPTLAGVK